MGQFYDEVPDKLIEWLKRQHMFHVATAPLQGGHVNVSPKGLPTFKLVSKKACWYLDLTGSGNETISHMYEPGNGRITLLFESFEGAPKIVRLYGKGTVYERGTPEFEKFFKPREKTEQSLDWPNPEILEGARSVIWIDIEKVGTSCGYGVPFMKFEKHRRTYTTIAGKFEKADAACEDPFTIDPDKGLMSYQVAYNLWSIDSLPGIKRHAGKIDYGVISKTMKGLGLQFDPSVRRRVNAGPLVLILVMMVGILLGVIVGSMNAPSFAPLVESLLGQST